MTEDYIRNILRYLQSNWDIVNQQLEKFNWTISRVLKYTYHLQALWLSWIYYDQRFWEILTNLKKWL